MDEIEVRQQQRFMRGHHNRPFSQPRRNGLGHLVAGGVIERGGRLIQQQNGGR